MLRKPFLPSCLLKGLEMSSSFPNNSLFHAFNFYSKALHYGYRHSFWLVRHAAPRWLSRQIDFLQLFSNAVHHYFRLSDVTLQCRTFKQASHKISVVPKTMTRDYDVIWITGSILMGSVLIGTGCNVDWSSSFQTLKLLEGE